MIVQSVDITDCLHFLIISFYSFLNVDNVSYFSFSVLCSSVLEIFPPFPFFLTNFLCPQEYRNGNVKVIYLSQPQRVNYLVCHKETYRNTPFLEITFHCFRVAMLLCQCEKKRFQLHFDTIE